MKLPVFPLPLFLLPGGCTRLRIFEPRYLRMVREYASTGFVITYLQKANKDQTSPFGAWVELIDFATTHDGLLQLDVKVKALVRIGEIQYEPDNLRLAECCVISHWPESQVDPQTEHLPHQLERVFEQNAQFAALYSEVRFDSLNWVVGRFLEMLPLTEKEQGLFVRENSLPIAVDFLNNLLI
jgi:Lon protease-like protein